MHPGVHGWIQTYYVEDILCVCVRRTPNKKKIANCLVFVVQSPVLFFFVFVFVNLSTCLASGLYKSKEFDYDDYESEGEDEQLKPPGNNEIKNGQWLGVAVKSQGPKGKVMVCAHRYIKGNNLKEVQHGLGLCYSLHSNLEWDAVWEPCEGREMSSQHEQFGYCQAGTSLNLLPDGTALIGSPGPYTWRGTMFVVSVVGEFLERDKNYYLGNLTNTPEPIDKYSYLGMSVTAGNFFNKTLKHYVSGAPRANHKGAVYFFTRISSGVTMPVGLIIDGKQFASNFGYELLTADLNNDGYDDLMVAAPFYYNNTHGGAVYVYYNLRKCFEKGHECEPDLQLTGTLESRFGFSMTTLGDINHDGYVDVAIGAPYTQPNGAIYIYLGGENGLNPEYSQMIQVKGPKTVGYSLSGGMDMDDNDYPDLLTGAYESDKVILFKARSIIHIDIEVRGEERFNIDPNGGCPHGSNRNRTCFSFETCFKLKRPKNYGQEIRVKLFIEADVDKANGKFARVRFDGLSEGPTNVSYITWHNRPGYQCSNHVMIIKENIRDILSPIMFRMNYTLVNDEPMAPILNKTSLTKFKATFQKDCGTDDICESNMILKANLPLLTEIGNNRYSLNLGSADELNFKVTVKNSGESAYEAQLFVVHPSALSYIALNKKSSDIICNYHNDTIVSCTLGNPFPKNKTAEFSLRFESKVSKIGNEKELNFMAFVNSTSKEKSKQTKVNISVEVKKKAEVKIDSASTSYVLFGGPVKGESAIQYFDEIGTRVWHTYLVINEGPYAVDNLKVNIQWPLQVESGTPEGKWLLYLEGNPTIEYDGNIPTDSCYIKLPFIANELNITDRLGSSEAPPENLIFPNIEPQSLVLGRYRRRRELEFPATSEKLTSDDGKRNVLTLDCESGTAKCANIECILKKVNKDNSATIKIKARIWNSTLVENYSKLDSVKIVSSARIYVPDDVEQDDTNDDERRAETSCFPENTDQNTSVQIWLIIVSVVVGVIVLLLIIFILYKCGFFKRNRVDDHTLSGNLMKVGESENLLNR
ncbi:PREDICTED: integrin alpha-PS1 [Nicrophorus vespilloides]|uniref:Integrin alpha-PS1 n=1 Tax=Nicrophorus vespilloides TaxID=110193 RepID=A0ABM1MNG7_NICVS|nr:PREDICTED: integrin alpha-PS1 [Nicrophorus vespilloides]